MRRLAAMIMALMLSSAAWAATGEEQLLERANKAFTAQNYKEAAEIYEQLIEQAPHDPRLLYNLGTAYAHLGDRGLAQWRYLQALQFAPRDRMLRQNLAIIDPEYETQIALTPLPPLNMVYWLMSGNEWTAIAAWASVAGLFLGAWALWRPRGTRLRLSLRKAAIVAAVVAAVAWPFAFGHYHQECMVRRGVIVSPEGSVKSGPSENSTETWKLKAGTVVDITDERTHPDWPMISFGGKGAGFISRDQIRRL